MIRRELAEQLLAQAQEQNIELVGPGGLLNQLTKNVLKTALDAEMVEHLRYEKHDPLGHESTTSTEIYLHADKQLKQEAIDWIAPAGTHPADTSRPTESSRSSIASVIRSTNSASDRRGSANTPGVTAIDAASRIQRAR